MYQFSSINTNHVYLMYFGLIKSNKKSAYIGIVLHTWSTCNNYMLITYLKFIHSEWVLLTIKFK